MSIKHHIVVGFQTLGVGIILTLAVRFLAMDAVSYCIFFGLALFVLTVSFCAFFAAPVWYVWSRYYDPARPLR